MAFTTKRKLPRFVLLLVATCCSLLIAACGSPAAKALTGPPPGCHGAECNVNVDVNNCVVSVDPDPIPVPNNIKVIKWWMNTTGYHFEKNGIVIKNPGSGITPDPGVPPGNPTMFVMHDDHTVQGTITYTVTAMPDSGGAACVLDPIIYNQ